MKKTPMKRGQTETQIVVGGILNKTEAENPPRQTAIGKKWDREDGTHQAIKKIPKSRGLKEASNAVAKMPKGTEATSPRQDVAEKMK